MNPGDRVKMVSAISVYPAGCKGIVDTVGDDGYLDVSLDEDERGNAMSPSVVLPPSPKNKFELY